MLRNNPHLIIRFHPEAERELREAQAWYAQQRLGLDAEFMRCVDEAICRIRNNPYSFPLALRQSRKALVKRFLYFIFCGW
jgi:toxin ParE1/3/4